MFQMQRNISLHQYIGCLHEIELICFFKKYD